MTSCRVLTVQRDADNIGEWLEGVLTVLALTLCAGVPDITAVRLGDRVVLNELEGTAARAKTGVDLPTRSEYA
jgi:hypothetical protein